MNSDDMRLDGNAVGGMLNEIFPFEMTTAEATCRGCGTIKCIGELMLYQHGMGAVLRCAGCGTALLRITHTRGRYHLDPSGMSCLMIAEVTH